MLCGLKQKMISTNNEKFVNGVNGPAFTSETSFGWGVPWDS